MLPWFIIFLIKKTSGNGIKNKTKQNEQLAKELHKLIIKKFKKRKVCSSFRDNISVVDLADMQLISKFNTGVRYFCIIDMFSKYVWVVPLKDKKDETTFNAFQKVLDKSDRKTNKIWVDKGSEFSNSPFKKWLNGNDIEMYSTHNEGKYVVAERFIITLKSKIFKYMTSVLKNVYIDKLDDIVNEYNNTYHRTIKTKPVHIKSGNYVE